jgi:hypothetical protein
LYNLIKEITREQTNATQPYRGLLAEPIRLPRPDHPTILGRKNKDSQEQLAQQDRSKREEMIVSTLSERMTALHAHFNTQDNMDLLFALAFAHVPGFRVVWEGEGDAGPGRKKTWHWDRLIQLWADVQSLKDKGKTLSNAFHILSTNSHYQDRYAGISEGNLKRRYHDYIKSDDPAFQIFTKVAARGKPYRIMVIHIWAHPHCKPDFPDAFDSSAETP